MKDFLGNEFTIGDRVIRTRMQGNSPYLEIQKITDIRDGKLYLDGSKQPIQYPERLFNLDEFAWDYHLEIINEE